MLTPTYVNLKYFFYPIGNTPAVNLLRDFRPHDGDNIKVLLLACGDVRNILFTLWSEGELSGKTRFDFTACDFEPGVLARNVLLLTFLARKAAIVARDDEESHTLLSTLWNIYYHLFVTATDLTILQSHAKDLVNASENRSTWASSPYGHAFSFLNAYTISELRGFWILYCEPRTRENDKKARSSIKSFHETHAGAHAGIVVHTIRAAGPHTVDAIDDMSKAFGEFWSTGVVAGNELDHMSLLEDGGGWVNPLMSISSAPLGDFAVHYGSDPLAGFHLPEVFDKPQSKSGISALLAHTAKSQFFDWCQSYVRYVSADSIVIRLHCGEAVNFSHALQLAGGQPTLPLGKHSFVKPWSAERLELVNPPGSNFDIIDTSNIIDHIGILNVMPAVVPLLCKSPGAVMYTESLLQAATQPQKVLQTLLHGDVTTASLIFGIAPVGHLLGTTTDPHHVDQILNKIVPRDSGRQRQFRNRVPWRRAFDGDQKASLALMNNPGNSRPQLVYIAPKQLALWFFNTYLDMFKRSEDLSIRMETIMRRLTNPLVGDLTFYSRLTLVGLLALATHTVSTDWETCVATLVAMIETDRTLIVSSNSLQELYVHLHTSGLWDVDALRMNPRQHMTQFGPPRTSGDRGLLARAEVPPIAHIALVVPRGKLGVFTDSPNDEMGTPGLHLSVFHEPFFENCFFAIDVFFGRLVESPDRDDICHVEEDALGWSGSSDLIVTCAIPTFSLLIGRRDGVRVALAVNTSPDTISYTTKLGIRMRVYDTGLDSENLYVLSQAPMVARASEGQNPRSPVGGTASPNSGSSLRLSIPDTANLSTIHCAANGNAKTLSATLRFVANTPESVLLQDGENVEVAQASPCTMSVTVGNYSQQIAFPYPVDGAACKTRIARKSLWVELNVPLSSALQQGGYALQPFPVIDVGKGNMLAWGMGRTNIDRQPLINLSPSQLSWLEPHIGMMFSEAERLANRSGQNKSPLLRWKETLHIIFTADFQKQMKTGHSEFQPIMLSAAGNCDIILLPNGLHYDLDTGSVFVDAFVIPLTLARNDKAALCGMCGKEARTINITKEEETVWKQVLPATVERCRTWSHKARCEYKTVGSIPLSVAHGESPICSCGEARDAQRMPQEFQDLAPFATRVAIPLLSAVASLEAIVSDQLFPDYPGPQTSGSSQHPVMPQGRVLGEVGSEVEACGHCGKVKEGLKACVRCGRVRYCNHACQKADWKAHKKICGK
ncbi:hypothetical protein F4778DRAFT_277511 [Xylariomycetidae sp. FL2044]|nr:hypothetical protein F4778DRAFT_277511 [Xylariomycetidae sp. FL2044]